MSWLRRLCPQGRLLAPGPLAGQARTQLARQQVRPLRDQQISVTHMSIPQGSLSMHIMVYMQSTDQQGTLICPGIIHMMSWQCCQQTHRSHPRQRVKKFLLIAASGAASIGRAKSPHHCTGSASNWKYMMKKRRTNWCGSNSLCEDIRAGGAHDQRCLCSSAASIHAARVCCHHLHAHVLLLLFLSGP